MKHGTLSGYTVAKCRCGGCREANARYMRSYRLRARKSDMLDHGTARGYNLQGCRCAECKAAIVVARLKNRYGLDEKTYRDMWDRQNGMCPICQNRLEVGEVHVDHDHLCCRGSSKTCGRCVRGLLCRGCNLAIGRFKDDPDRIREAVTYISGSHGVSGMSANCTTKPNDTGKT